MTKLKLMIIIICLLISSYALAKNFNGTYTLNEQGTSVTLTLSSSGQTVTGTLTSNAGANFKVNGMINNGAAVGTCTNDQGGAYFEATMKDGKLLLTLVEPNMLGMPDYNTKRELLLTPQSSADTGAGSASAPSTAENNTAPSSVTPNAPTQSATAKLSDNVVTDPGWGFKFNAPEGWKYKNDYNGAVLGHDSIAGLIVVIPHNDQDATVVRTNMTKGLQEGKTQLFLKGALESLGNNAVAGDYEGVYEGQQAKARGIGTTSPYGGGAYIIAVSTPDKFNAQLSSAGDAIAKSMQYIKVEKSALLQHFAGKWTYISQYSQTDMYLYANGRYSDHAESSYGGNFTNQYGESTGGWRAGGNDNSAGHWTVNGNKQQGTITITYKNGKVYSMPYNVHVEKGQTYWNEYYFSGQLYGKSGN